jgi:hypothetical protein
VKLNRLFAITLAFSAAGVAFAAVSVVVANGATHSIIRVVSLFFASSAMPLQVSYISRRLRRSPVTPGAGMRAAAQLMPQTAGQEWLAEARSVLFDAPAQARRAIARSYLLAAPQVFVAAWVSVLAGRTWAARDAWVSGWWK